VNTATVARIAIELSEYQRRRVSAPTPTEADVQLADKLMGDETNARLVVRWLANGDVDITASSWVGVVRFTHLDVRVVPKLVGGALRVLRMIDYAAGVNMLGRLPVDRPLPADGRDLVDLICLLLARETDALVRDGLLRDYRATDDTLKLLRGRLRYRDQYLRQFGRLDRLECHFDEYDSDTADNQLVAARWLSHGVERVTSAFDLRSAVSRASSSRRANR
jgi:5-methylcytosine-specific restriction enzyme subunit McrC